MKKLTFEALETLRQDLDAQGKQRGRKRLLICGGTGCHATGSIAVKKAIDEEIVRQGLSDKVQIVETGCNGFCALGPLMVVQPEGIFYEKLSAADVPEIVQKQLVEGAPVERLLYKDPNTKKAIAHQEDIPFFSHQKTWVLRNKGLIDPERIEDYIVRGGYAGVAKALREMTPEEIVRR